MQARVVRQNVSELGLFYFTWAQLFKPELPLTLGSILTCCFNLCIYARLFISKFRRKKLPLIHTTLLKKYHQIYKQAVRTLRVGIVPEKSN